MTEMGINLNFTAAGVDIPRQLRELRQYNFDVVRLNIIRYNTTQGAIDAWRGYAQYALSLGFKKVIWGFGAGNGITSSNTAAYEAGILQQAQWFQQQNDPRLEFQIGNEEELHHDASITDAQVRAFIRQLATKVKAVYTVGKISYSSSVFIGDEYIKWSVEGLGGLDRIGFNLYGSDNFFKNCAQQIVARFGNRGFVSEWGTNEGYQDFGNEEVYFNTISRRKKALIDAGIPEAYYYNFMESGNRWGIKNYPITGAFRAAWSAVLGLRPWFNGNPNNLYQRLQNPMRSPIPPRNNNPNRSL